MSSPRSAAAPAARSSRRPRGALAALGCKRGKGGAVLFAAALGALAAFSAAGALARGGDADKSKRNAAPAAAQRDSARPARGSAKAMDATPGAKPAKAPAARSDADAAAQGKSAKPGSESVPTGTAAPTASVEQTAAPDAVQSPTQPAETTPAPTPTAAQPPIKDRLPDLLAELRLELKEAEEGAGRESADEIGVAPERLGERLDLLRAVESVYERHQAALKRLEERRALLADLRRQIGDFKAGVESAPTPGVPAAAAPAKAGRPGQPAVKAAGGGKSDSSAAPPAGSGAPPPGAKLADLDAARDALGDAEREAAAMELTVQGARKDIENAEKARAAAEAARAEASDKVRDAAGAANLPLLQFNFRMRRIDTRLARANQALAETQLDAALADRDAAAAKTELLRMRVASLEGRASFSKGELDERRAELAKARERLDARRAEAMRNQAANEKARDRARDDADAARGDKQAAEAASRLDRREAWAQTSALQVEYLDEAIAALDSEREFWERRYDVVQGANDLQLEQWERDLSAAVEAIDRKREVVESRRTDARAAMLETQKRLEAWDPAWGAREDAEGKLAALRKNEEAASEILSAWGGVIRLGRRALLEIHAARQRATIGDRILHLREAAGRVWSFEIYAREGRSFRLGDLIQAAVIFFGMIFVLRFAVRVGRRVTDAPAPPVIGRARPFHEGLARLLIDKVGNLFIFALAVYPASLALPLGPALEKKMWGGLVVATMLQAVWWGSAALDKWVHDARRRGRLSDPAATTAFGPVVFFGKVALWSIAVLLALDNLGFDVTAILAGLGIGGVAVAFALQNVLGDIICSVAILLDKPFVVGDFIVVEEQKGVVELIGVKTTRLRSVSGEQVIFPNAKLIGSRIRNFKRMWERRADVKLCVTHDTPPELLERIPDALRAIIEAQQQVRFERAHLAAISAPSIDFEAVYYVLSPDFQTFMDIQQRINLEILRRFAEMEVHFAVPGRPAAPAPARV